MINQLKLLILLLILLPCSLFGTDVLITNLKVEYTESPLGIDVKHPRFSWQMQASGNNKGDKQTAYQLVVRDEFGDIAWNSNKIQSDISVNVEYKGKPLRASTRYNWEVTIWGQDNQQHIAKSWFETGLMNADPQLSAWNGAKWIGGNDEDMVFYSHYLPMFKINYSVQLDKKSKSYPIYIEFGIFVCH